MLTAKTMAAIEPWKSRLLRSAGQLASSRPRPAVPSALDLPRTSASRHAAKMRARCSPADETRGVRTLHPAVQEGQA